MSGRVGLVAIGRNEGERLRRCLKSVESRVDRSIYVDSGSSDDSVALAQSLDVEVVTLDMSIPFTAARARNAGFNQLLDGSEKLEYVQFVDGDCEVVEGWIESALEYLDTHPEAAVVCGRRRERYPQASVYNQLCDVEWDTPPGEAKACGGDAMMRIEAFQAVGGFNEGMIAGEEPELCFRFRQAGWKVQRLAVEMTLHDAAMTQLRQWWKRAVRAGHAYAEGSYLHGQSAESYNVRPSLSIWLWGFAVPLMAVGGSWPTSGLSLLLSLGYLLLGYRAYQHTARRGYSPQVAWQYAFFCTLGKFPNLLGQCKFYTDQWLQRQKQLIEYK